MRGDMFTRQKDKGAGRAQTGEMMKKLKAIGFAVLYLAIPFCINLLISIELAVQMNVITIAGVIQNTDQIMEKFMKDYGYQLMLVALVNLVIIAGVGLWYFFIRRRRDVSEVSYRTILSPASLGTMAALAVCAQYVCNIILIVFAQIFPETYANYTKLMEMTDINVLPAWATVFIIAVWAPLAEELVFRAMVFRTLRKGFRFFPAALISGVAFGVYHLNWVQGVYAGLLGILLAFIYEKTNSLLGCYLFHFMFNLFNYGLSALEGLGIPEAVIALVVLGLTVASFPGLILLIRKFSRIYRAEETASPLDGGIENENF